MDNILDHDPNELKTPFIFSIKKVSVWVIIIVFSFLLKFMQWPFGTILKLVSTGGLMALSINAFIILKVKNPFNVILLIFGAFWTVYLIWGMVFNGGYPHNINGVLLYFVSFILILIIYQISYKLKVKKLKRYKQQH